MGCVEAEAHEQGAVLPNEYQDVRSVAPAIILNGGTSFAKFEASVVDIYGERFRPYVPSLWREASTTYAARNIPGAPKIEKTVADFLPSYDSIANFTPAQLSAAIKDAVKQMAEEGRLGPARGVEKDQPSVPTAVTSAQAQKLGLDPKTAKDYVDQGIPLSVATQSLRDIEAYWRERAHDLSTAAKANPTDQMAQIQAAQAIALADVTTIRARGNETEIGRALRQLQVVTGALKQNLSVAHEFQRVFGGQGTPASKTSVTISKDPTAAAKVAEQATDVIMNAIKAEGLPGLDVKKKTTAGTKPAAKPKSAEGAQILPTMEGIAPEPSKAANPAQRRLDNWSMRAKQNPKDVARANYTQNKILALLKRGGAC